jgi:hypothetical protein
MNDNIDKISEVIKSFTPEEKVLFAKIQNKLIEGIDEELDHRYDYIDEIEKNSNSNFDHRHPEVTHPKHITDAPHEIIFYIKAEVSEVNPNGELADIKELVEKYYHIPVKTKEDYRIFMEKFFTQFQETLQNTCRETIINDAR